MEAFEQAADAAAPSPGAILQLGTAFWASKALLTAVELGLFTELARHGPMPAEEVGARLGLHRRTLRDFLDALVALGMLRRDAAGLYDNTPDTALFLDKTKPGYVGGALEMLNARLFGFWGRLTGALRTGEPQNETRDGGPDHFAAVYADPAALGGFLGAMTGISRTVARGAAAAFPWARHRSVADIGGAQGGFLAEILLAHPHLAGAVFDLPPVRPACEEYAREKGLEGRLRFAAGDFFADPLPGADVLVMRQVLHDWDEAQKQALLRKAHAALAPGGALLVYEAMIDDERREHAFGLLVSLNRLIETPGASTTPGPIARAGCASPASAGCASNAYRAPTPWRSARSSPPALGPCCRPRLGAGTAREPSRAGRRGADRRQPFSHRGWRRPDGVRP